MTVAEQISGMRHRPKGALGGEVGFTFIEVILAIILVGLLAALAANLLANSLDQSRFNDSFKEMKAIQTALVGNPELTNAGVRSDFGYVGDMGALPTSLTELLEQGAQPAWAVYDADLGAGTGWRGPYIDNKRDDSGTYLATRDGWGNAYRFNELDIAGTGQVRSWGSDGASGGSGFAADITVPETSLVPEITGSVSGRVTDALGNPVRSNTVTIRHPNPASPGNFTDTSTTSNATDGSFSFTGIPIGKHRIQTVIGGQTVKHLVVVLPNQTVTANLQSTNDPTTPSPVSGPAAAGSGPNRINLTWTPPTTNTDGSSLIDLAGYNIYRSTTSGFAPGPSTLLASIGLASAYSDLTAAFGTTYYYHIRPVDKAGNINTASTQVSAQGINGTGSIVQVSPATVSAGGAPTVSFNIWNTTGAAITVSSVQFSWSGTPPGAFDRIWSPSGTLRDNDPTGSGTCNTLDTSFAVGAGATVSFEIRFTGSVGTNQNIQINLYTAAGCGGTNVSNGFTLL